MKDIIETTLPDDVKDLKAIQQKMVQKSLVKLSHSQNTLILVEK